MSAKRGKQGNGAGAIVPTLDRLLPLKALIFAHHQIFEAVVADILCIAREEYRRNLDLFEAGFRADFAERFIIFDNELDDGFQITENGFWTFHRKMVPDEESPGHMIEGRFVEPVSPMSEFWSPWSVALAQFSLMLRSGELCLWGRWNTRSAPLTRITADIWPDIPFGKDIDFENGTLSFPDGEVIYSIRIEAAEASAPPSVVADTPPRSTLDSTVTDVQFLVDETIRFFNDHGKTPTDKQRKGFLLKYSRPTTEFHRTWKDARKELRTQRPDIEQYFLKYDPNKNTKK